MKQEFRKIPSLDFRYEVSRDGVVRNIKSKKIKKQFITKFGYYRTNYRVNKSNPNYSKNGWDRPVHQLVMECWGPARPSPYHIIDHIDQNKLNNNIENLRWVTKSENRLNCDTEAFKIKQSIAQRKANRPRQAVDLMDTNTKEVLHFASRYQASLWLIENGKTTTKSAQALARRIAIQHYVCGYKIFNINAERLCDKQ